MRALANPSGARGAERYFKTGPGQYGEGDRFLGVGLRDLRALSKEFRTLPIADLERLLESPWHEIRLLALVIMANRYPRAEAAEQLALFKLYLRRTDRINNWDLVDVSAPHVVGRHLERRSRAVLRRLARSKDVWERRIAIVATQHLIRQGEFEDTLALSLLLIDDQQDLIHKATGWMLREVGKRDERTLTRFLDAHAGQLPRTALRYSLERLAPAQRKRYMTAPRPAKIGRGSRQSIPRAGRRSDPGPLPAGPGSTTPAWPRQ
jgi:3-methyladenine DNA glycosylase AlkD